jgi:hypothetical protein
MNFSVSPILPLKIKAVAICQRSAHVRPILSSL